MAILVWPRVSVRQVMAARRKWSSTSRRESEVDMKREATRCLTIRRQRNQPSPSSWRTSQWASLVCSHQRHRTLRHASGKTSGRDSSSRASSTPRGSWKWASMGLTCQTRSWLFRGTSVTKTSCQGLSSGRSSRTRTVSAGTAASTSWHSSCGTRGLAS